MVKYLQATREVQKTLVQSLGWEDTLWEGMATHCSILVCRIPWTEKAGGLQSIGSHRVGHNWSDWACMYPRVHWDEESVLKYAGGPNLITQVLQNGELSPWLERRSGEGNGTPLQHSVQFSRSVMTDSLRPHESQHARPPCPSPTQTHVHRVRDAIQPSHPRSSPSPPAPNPCQHQGVFQWVNSLQEVAKVLEFQLYWKQDYLS